MKSIERASKWPISLKPEANWTLSGMGSPYSDYWASLASALGHHSELRPIMKEPQLRT